MSELKVEVDPAEAGFAADRLRRLDDNFARYVDGGLLSGWLLAVSRHGKLVHVSHYGHRDREAGLEVTPDTLWRIYSMTKPITSVAAMMLYEEGRLELTDPVSKFIPAFKDMRVFTGGSDQRPVTVPAMEPVRVHHLLTHTSGLTYGFHRKHPVDAMYRAAGFDLDNRPPRRSRKPATCGPPSRCSSSRAPSGTTPSPPTSSAASSRSPPARAWMSSSRSASSGRSA